MNPLRALLQWLVLIGLAAGVLFLIYQDSAPSRGEEDSAGVFGVLLEGVAEVTFERKGVSCVLERLSDGWRLKKPFACHVDEVAVGRLLSALEHARVVDVISAGEITQRRLRSADFGLDQPAAAVSVVTENGSRLSVRVGSLSVDGREVYVVRDEEKDVVLVERVLWDALPKSVDDLRSRYFSGGAPVEAVAVEFRRNGSVVQLALEEDGWVFRQPIKRVADARIVQQLLGSVYGCRAVEFVRPSLGDTGGGSNVSVEALVNASPRLAAFGLEDERAVWVGVWERGRSGALGLRFGSAVPGSPDLMYALFEGDEVVVAVSNGVLTALEGEVKAVLAAARFYHGEPEGVKGFAVSSGDVSVDLTREGSGGWVFVGEEGRRADGAFVNGLLGAVLALRPEAVLPSSAVPLEKALARVVLNGKQEPFAVEVLGLEGNAREFGVRFSSGASNEVYCVAATNLPQELRGQLEVARFVDRSILSIPAGGVKGLSVVRVDPGGVTNGVACSLPASGGAWQSEDGTVDAAALSGWLSLFVDLRAEYVAQLSPAPQALAGLGLTVPMLEVRLDLGRADVLRRVLLVGGKAKGGGRYAMLRGADVVYVVSDELVESLEQPFVSKGVE